MAKPHWPVFFVELYGFTNRLVDCFRILLTLRIDSDLRSLISVVLRDRLRVNFAPTKIFEKKTKPDR